MPARTLRVAAFQFRGSADIARNLSAITRSIRQAARRGVRLLALQECALCGYPTVDVPSAADIDRVAQRAALREVARLSRQHDLFIVLGLATFRGRAVHNSAVLIGPDGRSRPPYHKRALYDREPDHFTPGHRAGGVFNIDGFRVGLRICYELRFPEYFRELFRQKVGLVVMPFAAGGNDPGKLEVMRSPLVSRAAENSLYLLTANSTSRPQTAPTCLIDPDGKILASAPPNREALLVGDLTLSSSGGLRAARIAHARRLCR